MLKQSFYIPFMALTIFFVLLTHLVSAHSFMGERDNFIVVRQDFSQQQILKSIAADGSEKMIDVFSKNSYVEVIPPFIYIHKHDQKELRVLTREGHQVFNLSHCEKFSANTFGLLVLRTNKQLETYVIKGQSFILVPTLLENVDQFKMSDTIIMVNRVGSFLIETYEIHSSRENIYPVVTQNWNFLKNISSISFNKNFIISKDWQQLTRVSNKQGNSTVLGRGTIKNFHLTQNHFIAHYGNDKVEIFNAFDKEFILTLPQVYTVKVTQSLTSFKRINDITLINELGEIFTLQMSQPMQFSQGEYFYALSRHDLLDIYNSSGDKISSKRFEGLVSHQFFGDYLCLRLINFSNHTCLNVEDLSRGSLALEFKEEDFNVGIHRFGLYQHNNDTGSLFITFFNGKQKLLNQISYVYHPLEALKKEYNFLDF